jgi:inorganic pyrophosphatase
MTNIFDIIVEIPAGSKVKYEIEQGSGKLIFDHILSDNFIYPENYGFLVATKGKDGDNLDVLILTSQPLLSNSNLKGRVVGILKMSDEKGEDNKFLCVPVDEETDPVCGKWQDLADIPEERLNKIETFFNHYKDHEKAGFTKMIGFGSKEEAINLLQFNQ